jgi:hypothetical protein
MADPAYIVDGVLTDGEAWVGIATTTLGSDTATVTFTSTDDGQVGDFSQYMDLVLVTYARSTQSATSRDTVCNLNNDTASNYEYQYFLGNGVAASASSGSFSGLFIGKITAATASANIFGTVVAHFFDINSGKYKSCVSTGASDRDGAGTIDLWATVWKSEAAVTELDLTAGAGFIAGSTFSLFGILPRMVA